MMGTLRALPILRVLGGVTGEGERGLDVLSLYGDAAGCDLFVLNHKHPTQKRRTDADESFNQCWLSYRYMRPVQVSTEKLRAHAYLPV